MIHDETELKWKIDQARTYSEEILDALIEGTNLSIAMLGEDTEDTAMLALMGAIESRFASVEGGLQTMMGTLAVAILQLARVERGVPRVTPSPPVD